MSATFVPVVMTCIGSNGAMLRALDPAQRAWLRSMCDMNGKIRVFDGESSD